MSNKNLVAALLLQISVVSGIAFNADASPFSYSGENPAIFSGAPASNSAALLASVPQPKNPSLSAASGSLSPASIVEQSVLAAASSNINSKIFSSNPGDSGSFNLGGGTSISYTNIAGVITLTVVDKNGTTVIGGF